MTRYLPLCLLIIVGGSPFASAQFSELIGRVPKDANTAIFIDTDKIFKSPVAAEGRWRQRHEAAFRAGVSAISTRATQVVLSARMDLEFGRSVWELSLARFPDGAQIGDVAGRFGGTIDMVEGKSAARLPGDLFVVQLTDRVLAAHTPANRQDVGRWLRSTDIADPSQRYSDYLGRAYRYATEVGTPLIMAIDLNQAASETQWAAGLGRFESWKGSEEETLAAAKLLAGIEGVTLGVTFGDRVAGSIRVDFSASPSTVAESGKDLLIEVLENHGSMIEDFRDWSPSVRDNTFRLSGPVSEAGLRRLLSVLALPAPLAGALDDVQLSQDDSPESAARVASQQYFRSVTVLLDDLRGKGKRDGVKTFGQAATWYAKYARKIDALPLLNVDPLLVDFGRRVADGLRGGEMSMKGVGMRTAVRTAGPTATYDGYDDGYYGGSYGGYRGYYNSYGAGYGVGQGGAVNLAQSSLRAEQQAETVVRTQERVAGAAAVQQLWTQIDQATAEIRRDMTAKYQVEF